MNGGIWVFYLYVRIMIIIIRKTGMNKKKTEDLYSTIRQNVTSKVVQVWPNLNINFGLDSKTFQTISFRNQNEKKNLDWIQSKYTNLVLFDRENREKKKLKSFYYCKWDFLCSCFDWVQNATEWVPTVKKFKKQTKYKSKEKKIKLFSVLSKGFVLCDIFSYYCCFH